MNDWAETGVGPSRADQRETGESPTEESAVIGNAMGQGIGYERPLRGHCEEGRKNTAGSGLKCITGLWLFHEKRRKNKTLQRASGESLGKMTGKIGRKTGENSPCFVGKNTGDRFKQKIKSGVDF